jgi:hypothetical protein
MRFTITVEVNVERDEGKFASRDDILSQLIEAIEMADPAQLETENGGMYSIDEWSVEEVPQPKRKKVNHA